MYKLIKKQDAVRRQIYKTYTAYNFITKEISPGVSLAVTEAVKHKETITTEYDRIYYLLLGSLKLTFGKETITLHKGDSCFISANTKYKLQGTFQAVIINQPAFGSKTSKG